MDNIEFTKSFLGNLKVEQLKSELRKRGLKVSGLKVELIKRLIDYSKEHAEGIDCFF